MRRNSGTYEHTVVGWLTTDSKPAVHAPEITTTALWAVVPLTTPDLTREALSYAAAFKGLDVHVSLLDIQVVPFPCPVDQPPIDKDHSQTRLRDLLSESGLRGHATVLYTRDWIEAFKQTLEPGSVVVIATKKRWWRTREQKLARALTKAGYQVMLLPVR